MCGYVCVCVGVSVCLCVCVCIYVYICVYGGGMEQEFVLVSLAPAAAPPQEIKESPDAGSENPSYTPSPPPPPPPPPPPLLPATLSLSLVFVLVFFVVVWSSSRSSSRSSSPAPLEERAAPETHLAIDATSTGGLLSAGSRPRPFSSAVRAPTIATRPEGMREI